MKLRPHSPEWFDEMRRISPAMAERIKLLLHDAGTAQACGSCGNKPASDYELEPSDFTDGRPTTARLCIDCLNLQQALYQIQYRPMKE